VKGSIVTDSAVACADFGLPFSGFKKIKNGNMMTMGTGATSSSMIKEMDITARTVRSMDEDPKLYRASDVFYSATVVGGRELDENKYGRIGPGFTANISVVDMKRFKPLSYPLSQYIYGAEAGDVKFLVSRGKVIKRDGMAEGSLKDLLLDSAATAESAILKLWEEARKTIL
jgi:cytosine/adenosine deaminase-related metal-dependent hydrolase